MDHHLLLDYCLGRPDAAPAKTEHGHDEVLISGQAFAVFGPEIGTVTLKCGRDADEAQEWRDAYPDDVLIAPYIGQYGWNTFALSADLDDSEFYRAVDVSYADVVHREAGAGSPDGLSGEATS